jgi:hypothetical protein
MDENTELECLIVRTLSLDDASFVRSVQNFMEDIKEFSSASDERDLPNVTQCALRK